MKWLVFFAENKFRVAVSVDEPTEIHDRNRPMASGSGTLMTRDSFYQLSKGSLLSIIIGACAPASTCDDVAEMARPAGVAVRKATRVPHRYTLSIDPPF
jgi:hypothetical protein